MRKKAGNIPLQYLIFIILLLGCTISIPLLSANGRVVRPLSSSKSNPRLKLVPSTILSDLQTRIKERPGASPLEMVRYANTLLEQKGFNYNFDLCQILPPAQRDVIRGWSTKTQTFPYKMVLLSGKKLPLQLLSNDPTGMCGECYFQIPARRVTQQSILVIVDKKQYQFKRPKHFNLDKVELVDKSLKKVLRTWQLSYQTIPTGISLDGGKLYLSVYVEYHLDALLLELSEDGSIQFKARSDVDLGGEGEPLKDYPKDPDNAYLSFMRFHAGDRSYIIKFSAPCT